MKRKPLKHPVCSLLTFASARAHTCVVKRRRKNVHKHDDSSDKSDEAPPQPQPVATQPTFALPEVPSSVPLLSQVPLLLPSQPMLPAQAYPELYCDYASPPRQLTMSPQRHGSVTSQTPSLTFNDSASPSVTSHLAPFRSVGFRSLNNAGPLLYQNYNGSTTSWLSNSVEEQYSFPLDAAPVGYSALMRRRPQMPQLRLDLSTISQSYLPAIGETHDASQPVTDWLTQMSEA